MNPLPASWQLGQLYYNPQSGYFYIYLRNGKVQFVYRHNGKTISSISVPVAQWLANILVAAVAQCLADILVQVPQWLADILVSSRTVAC
jgi:hypothetical protein